MRIAFMGTPDFSVAALDRLHAAGHEIAAVYTQPPRRAGRGKAPRKTAVHARAEALELEVYCPVSFKAEAELRQFQEHDADIAVVVAYGLLLPQTILDAPKLGCVNIHASLLPRWRGAAPIQRAIMAGDKETGVCIMQMEAGLDTGPVLLRRETAIDASDTAATLHDRLAKIGADAVVDVLSGYDDLTPVTQSDQGVTYAKKIDKSEARIDWHKPAVEIDRLIRGLSPFPGAWTNVDGERLKLLFSRVVDGKGQPGQCLDDDLTIACGSGAIQIDRLQRAGKSAAERVEVLRGFAIPAGTMLDE